MGLLDGGLATSIYRGFKGRLLSGEIRQYVAPQSGGHDEFGDPAATLVPVDTAIEGFTEDYDDAYAARAGIPGTDFKVNIFAQSAPAITPGKDDTGYFTRAGVKEWFQLREVRTDPAKALWTCQAFSIPEPS